MEVKLNEIEGIKISEGMSATDLVNQMRFAGLQASELRKAVEVIGEMKQENAVLILTFTSNMVSSGLRELFAQLCEERFVDAIITGIGSVEEDFIKTEKPFLLGDFNLDDRELHEKGINRIGNILVPNDRYIWLEKKLKPFFEKELEKQKKVRRLLAPHEMINDLGKETSDKNSFVFQCAKKDIPIFCPCPIDGAFGLQVHLFKQDHPEFGIDVSGDLKPLANLVLHAKKTGGIILGGGFAKHHAIGANILRGGFDYAVYVSTGSEFDGSLSGAKTREAISWGKINEKAETAYVEGDASILFPLIIAGVKG
ncbi:deoxyhypusine synthase [Candidatus Micrarchaeota archaeon]|nr:deoxyhypusine synthase [Candidatus Micrarchaeota archaeon]